MNLRKQARGRDCMIRLVGICNANPETTVGAHVRQIGISGFGMKAPDVLIAWACSSCHAYVDSHHDAETQASFAAGVYRTIATLITEGKIKVNS